MAVKVETDTDKDGYMVMWFTLAPGHRFGTCIPPDYDEKQVAEILRQTADTLEASKGWGENVWLDQELGI